MRKRFTESEIEFIKKHYEKQGAEYIVKALGGGLTYNSVKQKANHMGLKRYPKFRMSAKQTDFIRANIHLSNKEIACLLNIPERKVQVYAWNCDLRPRSFDYYTKAEESFIRENYGDLTKSEIAKALGRTTHSIHAKSKAMGLKRTEQQKRALLDRATAATRFKKGDLPASTLYDGAISERTDSNGNTYKHIRIAKAKWQMLHVYNWEKLNGPVPKNKILRSIDGNQLNCDPDNWELVDRAEHLEKNTGRKTLEDRYIISKIAHRQPDLKEKIARFPELIELKRQQIKLRRTIDECTDKA